MPPLLGKHCGGTEGCQAGVYDVLCAMEMSLWPLRAGRAVRSHKWQESISEVRLDVQGRPGGWNRVGGG